MPDKPPTQDLRPRLFVNKGTGAKEQRRGRVKVPVAKFFWEALTERERTRLSAYALTECFVEQGGTGDPDHVRKIFGELKKSVAKTGG
jgi:hypothetical protein